MKQSTLTTVVFTLALLACPALATAAKLNGSLGEPSGATDVYQVSCTSNANGATQQLRVRLIDLAPVAAPMISVQVIRGTLGQNTTDAIDGDTAFSPAAIVAAGNARYDVRVNKTEAGKELYTLVYECLNRAGRATRTAIVRLQNQ
jgi:hypothetical protein